MSGATATVNRSLAFDGGLAASEVGGAGAGAVTGASSGEEASGAELSEPSTDGGSVRSRLCPPSRCQSRPVARSPATSARTSTTLGRTRPYGRLALQCIIGYRVYVSTDGERQESRTGLRCTIGALFF